MIRLSNASLVSATAVLVCAGGVFASPLVGSGSNLPLPSPNPGDVPREPAVFTDNGMGGFTGQWSTPAMNDWIGTFTGTGPIPGGGLANPAGVANIDFTGLPTGALPASTIFVFADVDGGSAQNEGFALTAFDSANNPITTPWLNEPFGVIGTGTGMGGAILPNNMPGWDWDAMTGTYIITGTTVTGGNPNISVLMESNTAIAYMTIDRFSQFASMDLSAPVPGPGAAALMALGGLAATRRRR